MPLLVKLILAAIYRVFFQLDPSDLSKYKIPCKMAQNFSNARDYKGILCFNNLGEDQVLKKYIYIGTPCKLL